MMSEQSPFDYFIDLISFDQKLHIYELDIKKQEKEVTQLETQKNNLNVELRTAKNDLHDAKKMVDEKELEMKELEAKEADKKKRMDQVANQKEYKSIKHELENVAAQQLALEDVLVAAWNKLEIAQKKFGQYEKEFQQKMSAIDAQVMQKQSALSDLQKKLLEQKQIRSSKEEVVPEEWLEKYMVMRARVPDPVVPVVDGSCNSCFHQVTDQDLILINRNKLLQCKSCYRFLYSESLEQRAES